MPAKRHQSERPSGGEDDDDNVMGNLSDSPRREDQDAEREEDSDAYDDELSNAE